MRVIAVIHLYLNHPIEKENIQESLFPYSITSTLRIYNKLIDTDPGGLHYQGGGGNSGTERLPTAKRPRGAGAVNSFEGRKGGRSTSN